MNIFKVPGHKVPEDFEIQHSDCCFKPNPSVKLLGITWDQHIAFPAHELQEMSWYSWSHCRASPSMTIELSKLAFVAHLDYCSAVFTAASQTELKKLNIIQKIGSHVINEAHRTAHSAPLLHDLQLDSLAYRCTQHVFLLPWSPKLSILTGNTHPILQEMFQSLPAGTISNRHQPRIGMVKKHFSYFASENFNSNCQGLEWWKRNWFANICANSSHSHSNHFSTCLPFKLSQWCSVTNEYKDWKQQWHWLHQLHRWPVQWLKTAPAALVLLVAIFSGKRALTQTKLTLRLCNCGTNPKPKAK